MKELKVVAALIEKYDKYLIARRATGEETVNRITSTVRGWI